ncbi:hypothetical protein CDD82_5059 [Ophiocordyceps australis]|uniref:Uncharacterized protein n=1 Tax=Ophiocordyceps australis TaxID=1399860 RepID=A0A2C5XJ10_9HYPO|nr:hypothetical protein CDD82_5059 [Ophiocordyceps australis]
METTYDTRLQHLPPVAMTGGSVGNLERKQAIFSGDIGCGDATRFIQATKKAPRVSYPSAERTYSCGAKCKDSREEEKCVKQLQSLMAASEATVVAMDKLRVLAGNSVSRLLFPGRQQCAGRSRSPAWDCLELGSQWFTGLEPAGVTDLARLLGYKAGMAFAMVDRWRKMEVKRLEGTESCQEVSYGWELTSCEVECSSGEVGVQEDCRRGKQVEGGGCGLRGGCEPRGGCELERRGYQDGKDGRRLEAATEEGSYRFDCALPMFGCDQDVLAYQLLSVGSLRSARMLNTVMCAVELYHIAAKLLEMRDATIATGIDSCVGGLVTSTRRAVFPRMNLRGPLPPKLSGFATCPSAGFGKLCEREGATGAMRNTSVFAMSLVYNRAVYGGSISGLWALMDSGFMFDYSAAGCNADLGNRIQETFGRVKGLDTGDAALNAHVGDIVTVLACDYSALRAKAELEDEREVKSKPCVVLWDDLAALARYKLADALFCHVWYDSPGDEASLAAVGLAASIHDLIDIGPDVACGEISNIVPTLTGGDLSFERLRCVYIGLVATLEWFADRDPFNPAALAILNTHWWQLANMRHRPVALMSRVAPSADFAVSPNRLAEAPRLRTLTHEHGLESTTGQTVLDEQRVEMEAVAAAGLAEMEALVEALVRPVVDYMDGRTAQLPVEAAFCAPVLDACLSRRHSQKIRLLWRLALVMWKSGAMWAAVLASTQYSHQGLTNADRARQDFDDATWA